MYLLAACDLQLFIMRTFFLIVIAMALCVALACTPRDFLTRRLATDLITHTPGFREPQVYWLNTGVVSNKEFNSPDSMVLQRRGWIIGTQQKCPPGIDPPPCWDVAMSPLGVEVIRPLLASGEERGPFAIEVARRALEEISGITKDGSKADAEFTWHWVPLNPVGSALYDGGVHYRSTVAFRDYDDGWRVANGSTRGNQTMEDALRNSEPLTP
jgi:hypothetical protein